MADSFATTDDLAARWRPLSPSESSRAELLLGDASALVRDLAPEVSEIDHATLRAIVCAMVKRTMQSPAGYEGVAQAQQTAGPFQQGVTFANPSGELYLTKVEKRRLGIGRQRAFVVDLAAEANEAATASGAGEDWS